MDEQTDTEVVADQPSEPRHRWLPPLIVALALGAVVAVALLLGAADDEPASSSATGAGSVQLASVERRDLVATERYPGTLGFDRSQQVLANRRAVVTRAASEGATLRGGQEIVRLGEIPVFLLRGRIPAWRTMQRGMDDGVDVLQLERELVRLRLDRDRDIDVDRNFDSGTERAVERLQDRLGLDETGIVEAGQVVFMPGDARVARRIIDVGGLAPEGAPVMQLTSTRRIVTVPLPAGDAEAAKVGDRASVELPGGETVGAVIRSVATSARQASPGAGGGGGETVIDVELVLAATAKVDDLLDEAPVQVRIDTERAKNVLVVPVTALIALREGGYAVERAIDSSTSNTELIAVRPGLYADGLVELDSKDLERGDEVVVPA
jgi:peptidoglycan hydrolase-like protein with peptidoglycan-binding domain